MQTLWSVAMPLTNIAITQELNASAGGTSRLDILDDSAHAFWLKDEVWSPQNFLNAAELSCGWVCLLLF
jgi:hypothetical protein